MPVDFDVIANLIKVGEHFGEAAYWVVEVHLEHSLIHLSHS